MNKNNRLHYRIFSSVLVTLYISVMLFMFSCTGKEQISNIREGAEEIIIDVKNPLGISLDSMISRIEYIKLETNEKSLFRSISQVLFVDSFIIISDKMVVNVFDLSGKFKHSLGRKGQGPGEYIDVDHITFNPVDNTLTIFDRVQSREIHYNIILGTYLYTERRPFWANSFEYLESGFKAYKGVGAPDPTLGRYKNFPLIVTDNNCNIMYGDFENFYRENVYYYCMQKSLYRFDNKIYFSPDFSNMIYLVTDTMVIPKYYINIASYGMPPIDKSITNEIMEDYHKRYFFFNGEFIELKDFSYINVFVPDASNSFVIYSHIRKLTYFSTLYGTHPMFLFIRRSPIARYQDNAVVFEVSPWSLLMNKDKLYELFGSYKSFLDELFVDLDEDSNSMLVICHLNENM